MPNIDDLRALEIKVGTVRRVERNEAARDPAYKMWIDFGGEEKQSSAKITQMYRPDDLVGHQVVAVTGFEPRRIGGFRSDVLVLGVETIDGVLLLGVDERVAPGSDVS